MAAGAFGDLPPAGAGRDRIAARISLRRRFPGAGTGKGAAIGRPPEEDSMKVRTTIAGAGLSVVLSVLGCGAMTVFVSAAVSACSTSSTSTPGSADTSFSSAAANSPNPGVTTETVTAHAAAPTTSNPTANPVAAPPATGGGGTAGTEDAPLIVIGGVAVLAGGASLAYRRKVTRNR
jgi:cell division septation protein DedD